MNSIKQGYISDVDFDDVCVKKDYDVFNILCDNHLLIKMMNVLNQSKIVCMLPQKDPTSMNSAKSANATKKQPPPAEKDNNTNVSGRKQRRSERVAVASTQNVSLKKILNC